MSCVFFWCRVLSFPTLTCGVFVFSAVSAPPSSRLSSHSNTPYSSSVTLPVAFAWQVWDLVHCKGVGCTPWRPPHHSHTHIPITHTHTYITHTHSLAHTSLTHTHIPHTPHTHSHTHIHPNHTHTHAHYTLTHISPLVSAALPVAFAWQARDLVHCKGVGCTPWRPSGVLASLRITHTHTHPNHTYTTHSHTSHSHIHHTHTLTRTHTSLTHTSHTHLTLTHTHTLIHPNHTHHALTHISPLVSAALPVAFAWQARDLVHCKGVGCTPWRPSGVPPVSLRCPSGVPWSPRSAGGLVAFAWQARDLVLDR